MGGKTSGCFGFGRELDLISGSPLEKAAGAVTEQSAIAATMRTGPLTGRRMIMAGDVPPGEMIEFLKCVLRFRILDVLDHAGEGSVYAAPIFRRIVEIYFGGQPQKLYPWETELNINPASDPDSIITPAIELTPTPEP